MVTRGSATIAAMPDTRRPRVLVLAAEFPPIGGGGVMRMTKLVKYLARLGWLVTVVSCDEPAPAVMDPSLLAELAADVTVIRKRGPFRALGASSRSVTQTAGQGSIGRGFVTVLKALVNTLALPDRWAGWAWVVSRMSYNSAREPDVIISSGPPHSVHLAAARLASRWRIPLVIDLRDDWAGNPLYRSRAPWRDPVARRLEAFCLRRAGRVLFISELSRQGYVARYPWLQECSSVIPNGFDPEDFEAAPPSRTPNPDGAIEFLHAGSLHGRADGGAFFRAFGAVANDFPAPGITLHLLGSVTADQLALAQAAISPDHLRLEDAVPHRAALARMRGAGVLVVILNSLEAWGGTLTGKVFEYLAARRPILVAGPGGLAADLVTMSGAGVAGDPNQGSSLEAAIRQAAAMAADPAYHGADERTVEEYDRAAQAARWSSMLTDLMSQSHGPSRGKR
jgi:glycosyltransferase involved in cell wall biosynthesis